MSHVKDPSLAADGRMKIEWVRDFMPIQASLGHLYRYNYMPDYLRDYKQYGHLISNPAEVCKANGIFAGDGIS